MNKPVEAPASFSKIHLEHWGNQEQPVTVVGIPDQCIDELFSAASESTNDNFSGLSSDLFSSCLATVDEIRAQLAVSGAVIVDRLPVESYELDVNRRAAGILSNLIAPLMAQDIKGTLLYDVIDEGAKATGTIRRSKTNEEQPFHTDGPWHLLPPSIIGLFCIKPAAHGGYSQVSSLQYNLKKVITENPDALELLERLLMWNRMGQFAAEENPFNELPVIQKTQDQILIRHYVDYVKTGHTLSETDLCDEVKNLLDRIELSLADTACKPFKLEAGQMQFVNNWTVAHARAMFADPEEQSESPSGRHLLRLWNQGIATG